MNKAGYSPLYVFVFAAPLTCLAGCSSNTRHEPATRKVMFECGRGKPALVRFYPGEERVVLVHDGRVVKLRQEPTGSGFSYTDGKTGIRGKGNDISVEVGRMTPMRCHAM